jgi:hypothetical protein
MSTKAVTAKATRGQKYRKTVSNIASKSFTNTAKSMSLLNGTTLKEILLKHM